MAVKKMLGQTYLSLLILITEVTRENPTLILPHRKSLGFFSAREAQPRQGPDAALLQDCGLKAVLAHTEYLWEFAESIIYSG